MARLTPRKSGAFFDRGECFKWLALREPTYNADGVVAGASGGMLTLNGRYIRLTFDGAGSALWEVAAADGNGRVIPVGFHHVERRNRGARGRPEHADR